MYPMKAASTEATASEIKAMGTLLPLKDKSAAEATLPTIASRREPAMILKSKPVPPGNAGSQAKTGATKAVRRSSGP